MNNRFSKTILVLAIAGLLGSGAALAGNGQGSGPGKGPGDGAQHGRGGPAERVAGMARRLDLTMEQQIDLLELFDSQAQERAQLHEQIFADYGDEICALRATQREAVRGVLTEEQVARQEEMQARRGRRGGGPGDKFNCDDGSDD